MRKQLLPIAKLRRELILLSDDKVKKSSQRFFKNEIKCYGIKTALVKIKANELKKEISEFSKSDIYALCENLWISGILEESLIASELVYARRAEFESYDLIIFENWINCYINNWASCDSFCCSVVGEFFVRFPKLVVETYKWAHSKNPWMRRAAAVSLISPSRKGLFLHETINVAIILLNDDADLVQKGYGWLLKETCKKNEAKVFDFVMKNKKSMRRTALRYAIEKMPQNFKKQAMAK